MRLASAGSDPAVRDAFAAGTVLHNPVTREYARIVEHTSERVVGDLLAAPGSAVAGPHRHPAQEERFEVLEGTMGYRRGEVRGEIGPGESVTVPAGVVHDWWNAASETLWARVTLTPPRSFVAMIATVFGLAALGRTNAKGMPGLLDAALLAEAFGDEIIFERPPRALQRALAATVAPLARRRGQSVTGEDVVGAALMAPERWPLPLEYRPGGQAVA